MLYLRCLNSDTKFLTEVSDDRSSFMTGARCTAGSPVRASICADAASPFTTDLQARYTRAPASIQHVQVGTYKYSTYTPIHASICADAASPFTTDLQARYTRAPVSIQHVQVGTYKYSTYTPVQGLNRSRRCLTLHHRPTGQVHPCTCKYTTCTDGHL